MTGIENIIELKLTDEEKKAINTSAQDVKQMINEVDQFLKRG
jgi:malate/lactate dehydrogenase